MLQQPAVGSSSFWKNTVCSEPKFTSCFHQSEDRAFVRDLRRIAALKTFCTASWHKNFSTLINCACERLDIMIESIVWNCGFIAQAHIVGGHCNFKCNPSYRGRQRLILYCRKIQPFQPTIMFQRPHPYSPLSHRKQVSKWFEHGRSRFLRRLQKKDQKKIAF